MTRRVSLVSFHEALHRQQEDAWILWPFLVAGSSMMIYGRQGLGKSTLATQLAVGLTTKLSEGRHWLDFPIHRTGPVFYVQLDMPDAEMRELQRRAVDWGVSAGSQGAIFFPEFWEANGDGVEDRAYDFNVLRVEDFNALAAAVYELKPIAMIVDTISDAYRMKSEQVAVDEGRLVLQAFRRLMRPVGGTVIYLHHQRKGSNKPEAQKTDDPDAFLGRVSWEAFATASLQLRGSRPTEEEGEEAKMTYSLMIRKSRLVALGFDRISLARDEFGFFYPRWTVRQHLLLWPWTMEPELRGQKGLQNIMAAVASTSGVDFDSVERTVRRLREAGNLPQRLTDS